MRRCGVLLHITSLSGTGPVGTMGGEAREFVDFLAAAGHSLWQVLPLTPPSRGNSPYSAYSVFAGNPYLISFAQLEQEGLLPQGCLKDLPPPSAAADYEACAEWCPKLLRLAFSMCGQVPKEELARFREKHAWWLEDYALFMALREQQGVPFYEWDRPLLLREPEALRQATEALKTETAFWCYVQYLFFRQWEALKEYANRRGVRIMGDMPIYADIDSAEVWAHPGIFQLDENRRPTRVAGVPPDAFSAQGQLWGNPLYDWEALRSQGYNWWLHRMRVAGEMYHLVRIDHFRALEAYYAIPAGDATAENGSWEPGPGMNFLQAVQAVIPPNRLVAEDLGMLTDGVRQLLADSGLPGMKVLQFAFEPGGDSAYLPHNITPHCAAYIGTHDNNTALGWLQSAPPWQADFAREYLRLTKEEGEHWGLIRGLYASAAQTAVVQMQDVLGLGGEARMNTPAVPNGNWRWRMEPSALTSELSGRLAGLARLYSRTGG